MVAPVFPGQLRTANFRTAYIFEFGSGRIEFDQVVDVISIKLEVNDMPAAGVKPNCKLHFVRQFRGQVGIAAKTESIGRVRCPEGVSDARLKSPVLIDCESIFDIPGSFIAESFVVR